MVESDYSRLRDSVVRENFIVGLGYLEGYVFVRVLAKEVFPAEYIPNKEISATNLLGIPASTFIAEQKFGSTALNSTNELDVSDDYHLYQAFWGVAPSNTRVFYRTSGTEQRELDVGNWGTNKDYQFGYINGFVSPLRSLGPESEIAIPPHILYEFGVFNPLSFPISPVFQFYINRMAIGLVKSAELILRILAGSAPARLVEIGGLTPPKYNMKNKWGVSPVRLDASAKDVQEAVG